MDDSNFASLSPSLLARKGGAKPAMRPQHAKLSSGTAAQSLEDLGWNDMGADDEAPKHDAEVAHLTPAPSNPDTEAEAQKLAERAQAALDEGRFEKPEVHRQQEAISEEMGADAASEPAEFASLAPSSAAFSAPEPVQTEPVEETQSDVTDTLIVKKKEKSEAVQVLSPRKRSSALKRGKRAAFTLRLDAERHLKLRLACTLRNRSAQQLVTEALDELLGDMPDVDSLAAQVSAQN